LIHTDSFLSQVQNYNFALTHISPSSKYCKMVQADDWIFPDCIRAMVQVAEAHPTVGIVAAYQLEDEIRLDGLAYPSPEVPGRDACRLYFLKGKYLFGSPTSSLIRSELIRSRLPFYDERYVPFEDGHVCFDLLKVCDFGFVHQVLTYSRYDNRGILSSVRRFGIASCVRLSMLVAHGRDHLSAVEYEHCLKRAEREYFLQLTQSACAIRPETREFWEFHRRVLASINYSFDWKRFARWLPRAVIEKAWTSFWRRWDSDTFAKQDNESAFQQSWAKKYPCTDRGKAQSELR
jgi:hypothetical protein